MKRTGNADLEAGWLTQHLRGLHLTPAPPKPKQKRNRPFGRMVQSWCNQEGTFEESLKDQQGDFRLSVPNTASTILPVAPPAGLLSEAGGGCPDCFILLYFILFWSQSLMYHSLP